MISSIRVSQIMTRSIIVADASSTFDEVMNFFNEYHIEYLPVMGSEGAVGMISANDMIEYISGALQKGRMKMIELGKRFRVWQVMTACPVMLNPDESIERALDLLHCYEALPVVREGAVRGIVSGRNLGRVAQLTHLDD